MPIGACSNGTSFSWRRAGAWSVATQSITPLRSASTSARRSRSVRSGGFILKRLSSVRTTSSVSVRWCGRDLAADPRARPPWPARSASHRLDAGEVLEVHARVLVARRARASRATIVDSDTDGIPARPSRAETAPSCITPSPDSAGSSSCSAITPPAQPLVLERLAQHPGRDDRLAVVGEAERAGVAQLGHLGQLLAVAGRG